MTRNWEWSRARVRLKRIVGDEVGREPALAALNELINTARVNAQAEVIVSEQPFAEVLREQSADADCVFLGFELPEAGDEVEWHGRYNALVESMPTLVLVNSQVEDDLLA